MTKNPHSFFLWMRMQSHTDPLHPRILERGRHGHDARAAGRGAVRDRQRPRPTPRTGFSVGFCSPFFCFHRIFTPCTGLGSRCNAPSLGFVVIHIYYFSMAKPTPSQTVDPTQEDSTENSTKLFSHFPSSQNMSVF